jgi:DNA polymerase-3 subunit epsilon
MRELHGALLDARILAEVYLAMTGGQVALLLDSDEHEAGAEDRAPVTVEREGLRLTVVAASAQELAAHEAMLARITERNGVATRF